MSSQPTTDPGSSLPAEGDLQAPQRRAPWVPTPGVVLGIVGVGCLVLSLAVVRQGRERLGSDVEASVERGIERGVDRAFTPESMGERSRAAGRGFAKGSIEGALDSVLGAPSDGTSEPTLGVKRVAEAGVGMATDVVDTLVEPGKKGEPALADQAVDAAAGALEFGLGVLGAVGSGEAAPAPAPKATKTDGLMYFEAQEEEGAEAEGAKRAPRRFGRSSAELPASSKSSPR